MQEKKSKGSPSIMSWTIKALVGAFLTIATPIAGADVKIIGAKTCGKWVNDEKTQSLGSLGNNAWVYGFLSGVAVETERDILRNIDGESVNLWMTKYCINHPLSSVVEAADALSLELLKGMRR